MKTSTNLLKSMLILGILLTVANCSSIPDDSPSIFFEVENSLQAIDEKQMQNALPKTLKLAQDQFERVVILLNDAQKLQLTYGQSLLQKRALSEVKEVQDILSKAQVTNQLVQLWDDDISKFRDPTTLNEQVTSLENTIKKMRTEIAELNEDLQAKNQLIAKMQDSPPVKNLTDLDYDIPVAFFDTNKISISIQAKKNITSLANTLKKHPALMLRLVGDSDPRGPKFVNRNLALKRAAVVKNALIELGISARRVTIGTRETPKNNDLANLTEADRNLLNRKVFARFQTTQL